MDFVSPISSPGRGLASTEGAITGVCWTISSADCTREQEASCTAGGESLISLSTSVLLTSVDVDGSFVEKEGAPVVDRSVFTCDEVASICGLTVVKVSDDIRVIRR